MFVFDTNGRVRKVTEGIQFYEQDILCSSYSFSGDQRIELDIDYLVPGFGIVLMESDEDGPVSRDSNAYLFKIGANEFRVFERMLGEQAQKLATSCIFEPGIRNAHLTFSMSGKKIVLTYRVTSSYGEETERTLGEYKLDAQFKSYRVGFYSSAGNIIRSVAFLGSVPRNWRTSTVNTIGGRIAFSRDTLTIENCDHVAEAEQPGIRLEPGKYWLKYETEEVNGTFDIVPYMFPTVPKGESEEELEDDKKNILDGNFLHVKEPQVLTLKFKGRNGRIKNLSLADSAEAEFVETEGDVFYQAGSSIRIHLEDLKSVEWVATVRSVPEWEDMTKPCPYGIIAQSLHRYSVQDLGISLKKEFSYFFDVASMELAIRDESGEEVFRSIVEMDESDRNTLVIMDNVTMLMTSLVLTTMGGSKQNVIVQKTFKHYVPGNIESPIIVTRKDEKEAFDLSASYREVVVPARKIKLFGRETPLLINEELPVNAHDISLYGIPKGGRINSKGKTIQEFATSYVSIPDEAYSFTGNFFTVPDSVRNNYEYLALEYNSIDDYTYEFTNYEREFFDAGSSTFSLAKPVSKSNSDIIIYGIPKDAKTHAGYLYRVPSIGLMNSIDYYTDSYEQIDGSLFSVDFASGKIRMQGTTPDRYSHYIVDYLKHDSYVINYRSDMRQYEVDVSTDAKEVRIHYDMHDDGGVYKYARTGISADSARYIVLRRKEEDEE